VHSHYQPSFRRMVHDRLRQGVYGMVHCEWTPYALYMRESDMPTCIAAHNVEWLIWQRLTQAETRPLHKLLFDLQARLMRRFESDVFTKYQHVTAVSEGDAAIIRELGCQDVVVVPNGVDTDAYRPTPEDAVEPRTLVFTGSLDWRANQDALRWFINDVHPHLNALGPYRFYVVGRHPPAWLRDPAIVPEQLVVTGTVDDVRPWIAKAAVYVVPLRAGGGSRLKILEALAMRRAVVSTAVGAEGLDVESGRHVQIADRPRDFAAAISGLFDDRDRAAALGQAGRERVEALYGWDRIAPIQAALWRRILRGERAVAQS
jgi:glycosyltransferase involved in cell wall biosynthesis